MRRRQCSRDAVGVTRRDARYKRDGFRMVEFRAGDSSTTVVNLLGVRSEFDSVKPLAVGSRMIRLPCAERRQLQKKQA